MNKIAIALILSLLTGFTSQAQVTADFDPSTDFTKYKTYYFAGWIEGTTPMLNELDAQRIMSSLSTELGNRGLLLADSADAQMAMVLLLVVDQKTSTTAYTNYNNVGMGYGYRGVGWGAGVGGPGIGTSTTTYTDNDYLEGTLVVDFYDLSEKKLLWQGVLQKSITENPQKREKTIPKNMAKLMKKYPVKPVKKK